MIDKSKSQQRIANNAYRNGYDRVYGGKMKDDGWIEFNKKFFELEEVIEDLTGYAVEIDGKVMLVGDINKEGGYCDCCNCSYDIVTRYKKVYDNE